MRSPPSSWDVETSKTLGIMGHGSSSARSTGGLRPMASDVTDAAPCRRAVPMQSEPVSPPPSTITCLPRASTRSGTSSPATCLLERTR